MSAICGIIRFNDQPVLRSEIESMVNSSPWRGPDGTGYYIGESAGFAHLAFHVTPESAQEKQPLISGDGRLILLADARLDNREALFRSLHITARPGEVVTEPDLILQAYQKWGADCVEHFLGDFVFAVWDQEQRNLFMARDSLGAYCLYYHLSENCLVFASAISAILDLPFVDTTINEETVLRQIEFLPLRHEETLFNSVACLLPAHCMFISNKEKKSRKYWQIDTQRVISYSNPDDYAEHLLELVTQAVSSRLRSIGPVGISLSGGHDSTLLAAVAASRLPQTGFSQSRLKSFSYVFDEIQACDERRYIEPVVQRYELDAEYINADDKWTFCQLAQQPIAADSLWTNCFVQLPDAINRAARQAGCKVLINGQYGDPLFAGSNLAVADMISQFQIRQLIQYISRYSSQFSWKNDFINQGIRPLIPDSLRKIYRGLRTRQQDFINPGLTQDKKNTVRNLQSRPDLPFFQSKLKPGQRRRYQALFHASWAQGFAAERGLGSGRFGIESVSPYFDRRIVEFMLAVPESHINTPGRHRQLQFNTMHKVLPTEVCERTGKTGFLPLLEIGLMRKEKLTVIGLLRNSLVVGQGWVQSEWLQHLLDETRTSSSDCQTLSTCLHLELWLRAIAEPADNARKWSDPYFYLQPTATGKL